MSQFYMTLTAVGAAKIAAANTGGAALQITQMAVGDGGGSAVDMTNASAKTALIHENYRAGLTSLSVSTSDNTQLIAEVLVPSSTGGWSIREVGLFDIAGALIAYGNFPETYKPIPTDGTTRDMTIRAAIQVGTAANVTLVVDSTIVGASRAWVMQYVEAAAGNYALDTGAANAYVVALNPVVSSYAGENGMSVKFRAAHANTGTSTINAGGGAVPLLREDGAAVQAGDIPLNGIVSCTYDTVANAFLINSIVPSQLGALAKMGIGAGLTNDGSGNLTIASAVNALSYFMGQL